MLVLQKWQVDGKGVAVDIFVTWHVYVLLAASPVESSIGQKQSHVKVYTRVSTVYWPLVTLKTLVTQLRVGYPRQPSRDCFCTPTCVPAGFDRWRWLPTCAFWTAPCWASKQRIVLCSSRRSTKYGWQVDRPEKKMAQVQLCCIAHHLAYW